MTLSKKSFIQDLFLSQNEKTFQYDENLPSLPVPDLHQTLEKYLKSIEPFVTEEEYNRTKKIVQEFEHGIGKYLQEKLIERASRTKNWLHDWWRDYAYLKFRLPLSPLSNMAGPQSLNLTIWPPNEEQNFERMALNLHFIFDFFVHLREERIKTHESRKGEKLAMNQFRSLFNTTREPHKDQDKLSCYFRTKAEGYCPNHVVAMCNGHVWILKPWHSDDECYSVPELEEQLRYMETESKALGPGPGIGILTFDYRESWAENRKLLMSLSEKNAENLYLIESAILLVTFDENSPKNMSEFCRLNLCGDPTNRWADKSYGGIFYKNGLQASNNDHSPGDAMTGVFLGLYQHQMIAEVLQGSWTGPKSVRKLIKPERLIFTVNESIISSIERVKTLNKTLCDSVDIKFLEFTGFGRRWIRTQNLHPDSVVQCSLQLAYYQMHKKFAPTYETATTRQFYKSRTETVRSCSTVMADFVRAMTSSSTSTSEKKSKLLRALESQVALMNECRKGQGIDRHLMGLAIIAAENGLPELELTKDPAYTLSGGGGNYVLSTSTTGSTYALGGVAPMVQDGYGAFYSFPADMDKMFFFISTFVAGNTDGQEYFNSICRALQDIKEVLSAPHSHL